jgi:hypothetical protein
VPAGARRVELKGNHSSHELKTERESTQNNNQGWLSAAFAGVTHLA